nr:Flp pilus assembly protein CpaB [Actinomyces bowdenii]
MNPRQRKGVILIFFTMIGALVTFGLVASYVSSVASQVGPMTTVVTLTRDVESLTSLTEEDVEIKEVPERWVPEQALHTFEETAGLVTAGSYHSGDMLQSGMLEPPPGLQPGYREVAIIVDAETGVAGKVSSGETVDIIATVEDPSTKVQEAKVVVENALVIDVGVPTAVKEEDASGNFTDEEGVPVTFALTSQDALKIAYAESFAVKVRLALRGEGDDAALDPGSTQYGGAAQAPEAPAAPQGGE